MPRLEYKNCKRCKRHTTKVGPLSWSRQCAECGRERLLENIDGIHTHSGPAFARWRKGMAACVGAVLPDDV